MKFIKYRCYHICRNYHNVNILKEIFLVLKRGKVWLGLARVRTEIGENRRPYLARHNFCYFEKNQIFITYLRFL